MKQYVIDELRLADHKKIKSYLDEHFGSSGVDGIYWIPIDQNNLTAVQVEHKKCQPFYLAIELEPDRMSCELLVRSENRMRCKCIGYATEKQRNWFIRFIDLIFDTLEMKA